MEHSAGETIYQCSNIDYFSSEVYSPDPTDSTLAIPYTVKKAVLFFLTGSFLLSIGYIFCVLGQCLRHRALYTFISGVIFIVTGLVMLFGLIVYISVFKSEIGSKLRPRSHLHPAAFDYAYGYSFLLYVTGVVTSKFTGISCVFLFIYRVQYEWRRKQLEELKSGNVRQPPSVNNYSQQVDVTAFYPCRRHPEAYANANNAVHFPPSPGGTKRFYFRKESFQESPCSVHRARSQSNSLKDVSSFYDFPPPPTISYQFTEHFSKSELRSFPLARDVTSNTVSTTADLVGEDFLNEPFDDYSPSAQHEHEFVTFNLDQAVPMRAPSMVSISSRNGAGQGFGTLRRTTPV